MAQPSRHDHSPAPWLRRLDRAAGRMNPYLTILAIGLLVLDATCLVLRAKDLPLHRLDTGLQACPLSEVTNAITTPVTRVGY